MKSGFNIIALCATRFKWILLPYTFLCPLLPFSLGVVHRDEEQYSFSTDIQKSSSATAQLFSLIIYRTLTALHFKIIYIHTLYRYILQNTERTKDETPYTRLCIFYFIFNYLRVSSIPSLQFCFLLCVRQLIALIFDSTHKEKRSLYNAYDH